jgi:IS605 OrfB family transposase
MIKTFEYRLYPNRRQRELLMKCLIESRHLYNEMLAQVKDHYAQTGKFFFKYSLTADFKGRGGEHVPASTVQTLADRLDKALRRFMVRKELEKSAGFPRFKGANRWHSIRPRQYGKSRDVRLSEGQLKVPSKLGKSIKKVAKDYTENYSRIVVEELNVAGMVKNHILAKSIHDAGWASFVKTLEHKAEEAGAQVIKVPAHHTTQMCSECGDIAPKSLSARRHTCISCGHEEDRDINAAKNIKSRGICWISLSTMAGMPPSELKVKGCLELAPRSRLF